MSSKDSLSRSYFSDGIQSKMEQDIDATTSESDTRASYCRKRPHRWQLKTLIQAELSADTHSAAENLKNDERAVKSTSSTLLSLSEELPQFVSETTLCFRGGHDLRKSSDIDLISCSKTKSKKAKTVIRSIGPILDQEKQNLFRALEKFQATTYRTTSFFTFRKVWETLGLRSKRLEQDTMSMEAENEVTKLLRIPEFLYLPATHQKKLFNREDDRTAPTFETIQAVSKQIRDVRETLEEMLAEVGVHTEKQSGQSATPLIALYRAVNDATQEINRAARDITE